MTDSDDQDLAELLEGASAEELDAYRVAARVLKAASPLQRATCPSATDLIANAATLGARAAARDAHVAACPACRDDLADFRVLDAEPETSLAGALEAVRGRIVLALSQAADAISRQLELIESSLELDPTPALAPARGAGAGAGLATRISFGGGALSLEWGAGSDGLDLQARAEGGAPLTYRLALARASAGGGGTLESRTSGPDGVARIGGIAPGVYVLRAFGPQSQDPGVELELELRPS